MKTPLLGDRRGDRLRAELRGSFHGHDVDLRNLIATLPGESNRQIALIAPRDVAEGSGAVTTAAATAALLQIADSFSGATHHKTLVFVSTDGSSIGALGAKRFVRDYSDSGTARRGDRAQPAGRHRPDRAPGDPLVDRRPEHREPARRHGQRDRLEGDWRPRPGDEGPLSDLFRLALPAGLGEQGPLVEAGCPRSG